MSGIDVFAQLALRMKYPKSERMRAIFEKMVTLEEGELLLELPLPAEELARRLNVDEGVIESRLADLYQRGLVVIGKRGHVMPRHVFFLHDTVLASPNVTDDLADLWHEFAEEEGFADQARDLTAPDARRTRVIPAWRAVQTSQKILPEEDVRQIIGRAEKVVLSQCPCRRRGRCGAPLNICLQLDAAAEHVLKRGTGRQVSKEEAIEALGKAEEQGLIHTGGYAASTMCTCCTCCCILLRPLAKYGKLADGLTKSSYRSIVDADLCAGCQLCVDECHFDAIEMKKVPGSKKLKASIDPEKCFGCGVCVVKCPSKGALRMELANGVSAA